ncbi:MAG TPA: 30S ribosomal protein S20 [Candidatus Eisenbacteria bacterium]|nr:30S ribosomal protein S20 [Candidatus Eisenbacteria bacterium]
MPHHKSAEKRMRTAKKSRIRNASVKSEIKTYLKRMQEAPGDAELARATTSKLDRAVRKGVIPKSVANRRKSRLAKAVNRTKKAS